MQAAHPLLRRERRTALLRYALYGAGCGAAAYAAYRLYRSDGVASARAQAARLRAALAAYADAFGTGADTLRLLAADLHAFLASDGREVPASLRQLARLMQSPEVADTTSATVAALLRGVAGGSAPAPHTTNGALDGTHAPPGGHAGLARSGSGGSSGKPALDRVLDALMSERGHSLVSVAVSLGARNLVSGYCEARHRLAESDRAAAAAEAAAAGADPRVLGAAQQPDLTNRLLDFLASPRGQQVAVLVVTAFVSSGMRSYLDQTVDLNFYEDLFSAMAKPEHLEAVKAVVGVFARDVVGAYMTGPAAPALLEGPQAAAAAQQQQQQPGMRLSASIQELLSRAGGGGQQQQQAEAEAEAEEPGSPCGSSASGAWHRQADVAANLAPAAASDVDSDVLLRPRAAAKAGPDSARSHDSWAVRTPPAAGEGTGGRPAAPAALPHLRRVQEQEAQVLQRSGSGNLEWISAVGKEWLNVAQHPQGRTVMVELAGAAAKEAARGVSAALVDRFRVEWMLVAALAMLLLAWLMQRMLGVLLG